MQRHELLERVPLFKGLSEASRISLSQRLVERRFQSGELVFKKGDTGNAMFLVLAGKVEIFLPGEGGSERVVLKEVSEGEHFGELSLFDDKPRSASVFARLAESKVTRTSYCIYNNMPRQPATIDSWTRAAERFLPRVWVCTPSALYPRTQ